MKLERASLIKSIILLTAMLVLFTACSSTSNKENSEPKEAEPQTIFTDINTTQVDENRTELTVDDTSTVEVNDSTPDTEENVTDTEINSTIELNITIADEDNVTEENGTDIPVVETNISEEINATDVVEVNGSNEQNTTIEENLTQENNTSVEVAEEGNQTDSETNTTTDDTNTTTKEDTSVALTIEGSPKCSVSLYSYYHFKPVVNKEGVTFDVLNKPPFLSFDTTTGELSGIVEQEGVFSDITIRVKDAEQNATLSPFTLTVTPKENLSLRYAKAIQPPKDDYYWYLAPELAIDGNKSTYTIHKVMVS